MGNGLINNFIVKYKTDKVYRIFIIVVSIVFLVTATVAFFCYPDYYSGRLRKSGINLLLIDRLGYTICTGLVGVYPIWCMFSWYRNWKGHNQLDFYEKLFFLLGILFPAIYIYAWNEFYSPYFSHSLSPFARSFLSLVVSFAAPWLIVEVLGLIAMGFLKVKIALFGDAPMKKAKSTESSTHQSPVICRILSHLVFMMNRRK